MPACSQCGQSFSRRLKIEGKTKIYGSRKRCYDCSPIDHNRFEKKLKYTKNTKSCYICEKIYIPRGIVDGPQICNSCAVNCRRFDLKPKCVEYKGGKCQRCGYNKCLFALELHHRNPNEKDFNISGGHSQSWAKIQKELDKCDLVCSNCHKEIHSEIYDSENCKRKKYLEYKQYRAEVDLKNKQKKLEKEKEKEKIKEYREQLTRPTKDELLELLERLPYSAIAKIYDVSDNAVRKWCAKFGIDLGPRRGYWTKKHAKEKRYTDYCIKDKKESL